MDSSHLVIPARSNVADDAAPRRHTVIPTPRSGNVFPGWGVRF